MSNETVEQLIKRYDRYIKFVASKFAYDETYFDDYVQIGRIAIVRALDKFDDTRGDLHSFIATYIKKDMLDFKYQKTNVIKIPIDFQIGQNKKETFTKAISINTQINEEATIEDLIGNEDPQFNQGDDDSQDLHKRLLREHFPKLKEQYQKIIIMKEIEDMTFVDIGKELGISAEAVRQKYNKGINKLRKLIK